MKHWTKIILAIVVLSLITTSGLAYYKYNKQKNRDCTTSSLNQLITDVTKNQSSNFIAKKARLYKAALAGNGIDLSHYFDWVTSNTAEGKTDWEELYQVIIACYERDCNTASWHMYELMLMKGNDDRSLNPYFNRHKAYEYLMESAKSGEHVAQITFKDFYQYGDTELGIEPDLIMAAVWRSIISQGEFDAIMNNPKDKLAKDIRERFIKEDYQPDPLNILKRYISNPTEDELSRFNSLYSEYQQLYPTKIGGE